MTVNLSGIIVLVISAGVGGGAMVAAPSMGVSEGNALPFGILIGGIVACGISWYQTMTGSPNSIFFPMWMWGAGAAVVGVLGMMGVIPLGSGTAITAEQQKRLDAVSEKLRRDTVSASSPGYLEPARRLHGSVVGAAKKAGAGDKLSVHLELDAASARRAVLFVRVEDPRRMGEDGKKTLVSFCLKVLQSDYPAAACRVGLRGPSDWLAVGETGPNKPVVVTVGPELPDF